MNSESPPKSHPLSCPSASFVYGLVTQLNFMQVKCKPDSLWLIYLWTALNFRMSLQCNENEKEYKSDGLIASSSCCSSWRFKSWILNKNLLRKVTYAYLWEENLRQREQPVKRPTISTWTMDKKDILCVCVCVCVSGLNGILSKKKDGTKTPKTK